MIQFVFQLNKLIITYSSVYSLYVLHHLIQPTDQVGIVNLRQCSVISTQWLCLVDKLLPARIAREQWPLLAPCWQTSQLINYCCAPYMSIWLLLLLICTYIHTFAFAPCAGVECSLPFCRVTCCNRAPALPASWRSPAIPRQGQPEPPFARPNIATARSTEALYLCRNNRKNKQFLIFINNKFKFLIY